MSADGDNADGVATDDEADIGRQLAGAPSPQVSILFDLRRQAYPPSSGKAEPHYFSDLHLGQLVKPLTAGREEHVLGALYCEPVHDRRTAYYRQEVARDFEQGALVDCARAFTEGMCRVRVFLKGMDQIENPYYKQGSFIGAVDEYCRAVLALHASLQVLPLKAPALRLLTDYIAQYEMSPGFRTFAHEAAHLQEALAGVRYKLLINGLHVTVTAYEGEAEYSQQVEDVFAPFRQGEVKDFQTRYTDTRDANHVHAFVLEGVARLYPELFARMQALLERRGELLDQTVLTFEREAQYFISYLELIEPLKQLGLPFCYPQVRAQCDGLDVRQGFDLVLALRTAGAGRCVVCNDARLGGQEKALIVSGPNQGGKTTFARMIGQLHFLAGLGLPVPARYASLGLPDDIFTHFEHAEQLGTGRGKLEDELWRARSMLERATARSLIVLNESFSATTVPDALSISTRVLQRILEINALCVWVTFLDELSCLGPRSVSMVAEVLVDDPTVRTFKVVARPADGRAYARSLAQKHGLTYEALLKRVSQ